MRTPEPGEIVGFLDAIGERGVAGWAFRVGDENPLRLSLVIDGITQGTFLCSLPRNDVLLARSDVRSLCRHSAHLGFVAEVPKSCFDGAEHEVSLLAETGEPARLVTVGVGRQDRWRFSIPTQVPSAAAPAKPPTELRVTVLTERIERGGSPVAMGEQRAGSSSDAQEGAAPTCREGAHDRHISFTRFPVSTLFGIDDTLATLRRALTTEGADDAGLDRYESEPERLIAAEFEREYYLAANPDVAAIGIDPVVHYARDGWREKRRPNAWFDTAYYLEANPDVRDAGVNPFWHFLGSGRAEGRLPARAGGYRREILANLVEPHEKSRGYFRPSSFSKLLGAHLERTLADAMAGRDGAVLSVSHDCYVRSVGGIQIFITDEQAGFARRGFPYLNISPFYPDLVLAAPDSPPLLQLVLNGTYLGVTTHDELAEVLGRLGRRSGEQRIFVVHSVLGHQPERLADLHDIFGATSRYFWVHDFSSLCEGFNLLRNDISFCGAPEATSLGCRVCIYGAGRPAHLARMQRFFERLPFTVVAPSRSAMAIWREGSSLPYVAALVHEHCELEENSLRVNLIEEDEHGTPANPVRVAFAGHPGTHKGWPVFAELVRRARHLSCYRFYHFTSSENAPILGGVTRVFARTSPADRDAMTGALATHAIDLVVLPARCPETFSYVTYEALAAGADIVTSADSGNVADVVLRRKRGIVVETDAALFELFETLRAVEYVRHCYRQGISAGRLIHCGTTATLEPVSLAAAAE